MKLLILTLLIFLPLQSWSQAYCALRNPQSKIMQLYPLCETYNTTIGTIDERTRLEIAKKIPFPIHFYEIGKHNLYTIKNNETVLGLVHSRSEKSPWGLVEIIWSLNLDLSIKDFSFQRCRTASKDLLLSKEFKAQIINKTFYELKNLIDEKGRLNKSLKVPKGADQLCQILLQSALKTMLITDLAWQDKLISLRMNSIKFKGLSNLSLAIDGKKGDYYHKLVILKNKEQDKYLVKLTDNSESRALSIYSYQNKQLKPLFSSLFSKNLTEEQLSQLTELINQTK